MGIFFVVIKYKLIAAPRYNMKNVFWQKPKSHFLLPSCAKSIHILDSFSIKDISNPFGIFKISKKNSKDAVIKKNVSIGENKIFPTIVIKDTERPQ